MKRFEMRVDPLTNEIYYDVHLTGRALLQDPLLNKGHAFPHDERAEFDLVGLMPDAVGSLEDQIDRDYKIFQSKTTDLERYVNLMALRDRNETIYFALLTRHIEEMLPIVYTPTVGLACLKLSHILRRYRGVYISPSTVNYTEQMLRNVGLPNISLIVVTDGERILGYGDLGADGMGIPIGKIALYIAAAGIHPASTLPICIDIGTNNEQLLNDPLYLGIKKNRLRGDSYFEVVERFIQGVKRVFPRALLQWEDFGKEQAFTLLDRYKERLPSFNDDMQGTGSVAAAALRTTSRINCRPLSQEQIVIYGFGQAGSGVAAAIANQIHSEEGISLAEARKHIWPIDKDGLLLDGMKVETYQKDFVHPLSDIANWPVDKTKSPTLAYAGQDRLYRPAGRDLRHIGQLQIGLVVPHHVRQTRERDLVEIEGPHRAGIPRVHDAGAELVGRTARHQAVEDDSAIDVEVDQDTVRRTGRDAAEHRGAAVGLAAAEPPDLLIDHTIEAVIATKPRRHAGAGRIRQQRSVSVEALVVEFAEMPPGAKLQRAGETGVILALIGPELNLGHDQGRIGDTEVEAVAIAKLLVAVTGPGRIAVEHGDQQSHVPDRLGLKANARRGERVGRPAARHVGCRDRGPVALQEHHAEIAIEEFDVRRELTKPQRRGVVPQCLLEP
jgi:malic enzyme